MKSILSSVLLLLAVSTANAANLQGFGVIREFGGTDTAAMFGLVADSGSIQITGATGPSFLGGVRIGQLDKVAMDHLFLKSATPISQQERQDLVSKYNGAQVIYFEGYHGALCASDETEFHIGVNGTIDGAPFSSTFQFIALPNPTGDCTYHVFILQTQQ